jgi:hypothetical protein
VQVPAQQCWTLVQIEVLPGVHAPFWQVSPVVQVPALHGVPLDAGGFEQAPEVGSHVPATWHWSEGVQTTGLLPVQTPAWHM